MKQKESKKHSKKTFCYYFRVWKQVVKGGIKRSYLYKTDIFVRFLRTLLVVGIQIALLNVLFGKSEMYAGWSRSQTYLVIGIWNVLNYIGWSLFSTNLLYLESKVIEGKFDYILLKPLSSSFYASFSDFFITNFITALSGFILILYYIIAEWGSISFLNVLVGIVAICVALLIWYAIYLFFASFTISNPRNGILSIAKELLGLTKYPIDVFGSSLSVVFYTAIPIAFLTTVPANIMIGRFSYGFVLVGLVIGIILLVISKLVWNMNVKRYSSASS